MFSALALSVSFVAAAAPAALPTAAPVPVATPFTTVTPAPLPGAYVSQTPTPAPTPAPTPNFTTFANVSLGDTAAAVRKSLGKPFEVDPVNIGEMWRYNADGGNARLSVLFADGAALSITLSTRAGKKSTVADPYGVALGMTVDQLTSLRGAPITVADDGNRAYGDLAAVRWVYGIDNGAITDIDLSEPVRAATTTAPSALDLTNGHDGTSADRAIIVTAASAGAGTDLEYRYIKGQSCGQGGLWNVVNQTTVAAGSKWIDEFAVSCSTDKSAQTLYFDITSYAGK